MSEELKSLYQKIEQTGFYCEYDPLTGEIAVWDNKKTYIIKYIRHPSFRTEWFCIFKPGDVDKDNAVWFFTVDDLIKFLKRRLRA